LPTTEITTLSLHDALPISSGYFTPTGDGDGLSEPGRTGGGTASLLTKWRRYCSAQSVRAAEAAQFVREHQGAGELSVGLRAEHRSEEHTSELQSRGHLVCR